MTHENFPNKTSTIAGFKTFLSVFFDSKFGTFDTRIDTQMTHGLQKLSKLFQ